MFAGTFAVGISLVTFGLSAWLPARWMLPGLAAAAALGGIGGPMKDIPLAVLRQTRLAPTDMAAGMRAYMAVSSAGMLAAMLLTPGAIALTGVVPVVIACGLAYLGTTSVGLMLHAARIEDRFEPRDVLRAAGKTG
jgi:hypothetical protein